MPSNPLNICPVCSTQTKYLYTIKRFDPKFDIHRCPECKLQMQINNIKNPDKHYTKAYYTGQSEYSYRDERDQEKYDNYVHHARLKNISRFQKAPAEFLDIGCAFGGLVSAACTFGYNAQGLDVSEYAAKSGRKRGRKIKTGALQKDTYPANSFDIITMIEVIEHITNPAQYASYLQKILKPGGMLVVQTANFEAKQALKAGQTYHYYLPGHYHYYSLSNLKRLLAQYGFDRFQAFIPVDFGLIPKLKKSRGNFTSVLDYQKWFGIALYHWKGKFKWHAVPLTSSMVLYGFKNK